MRAADGALYRSQAGGRDCTTGTSVETGPVDAVLRTGVVAPLGAHALSSTGSSPSGPLVTGPLATGPGDPERWLREPGVPASDR